MDNTKRCCGDMESAFQSGTDNEAYGALAYDSDGRVFFGCDLPEVCFCPWCGKQVAHPRPASEVKEDKV
jgi:hypothetical protein